MTDTSYRTSHQMKDHGASYDNVVYGEGQYDANVWEIERVQLARIVQQYFPNSISNYLDFACGTGRILSEVAPHATQAMGLDISEEMVKKAREKVQRVEYLLGDITEDPSLLDGRGPFTGITMFRFLLNAEPALRTSVLDAILPHLAMEGVFICNNHGNQTSARPWSYSYAEYLDSACRSLTATKTLWPYWSNTDFTSSRPLGHVFCPDWLRASFRTAFGAGSRSS